jgi:hypothetical protein
METMDAGMLVSVFGGTGQAGLAPEREVIDKYDNKANSPRSCSRTWWATARLARLDDVLRTAHGMRRIGGDDLAGDEPVEQHADGREVLLDRRLFAILSQPLDIGRDVQRLDIGDLANLVSVAPGEEPHGGVVIGLPRKRSRTRRSLHPQRAPTSAGRSSVSITASLLLMDVS